MVESNNETPMETGPLAALAARLMRHAVFGERGTVGTRTRGFADRRASRHRRLWRPGTGSYALGAREMAVEIGLRYLPLAADPEFLPVKGYEHRELYPAQWQNWLNADLLRLFEDEEEAALAQAWIRSATTQAMARQAVRRPAAATAAAVPTGRPSRPAPGSPLQRRVARIAQLTERLERVVGPAARPLQEATRARALRLAPADVAQMVTLTADALREEMEPRRSARPDVSAARFVSPQLGAAAAEALPAYLERVARVAAEQARSPYPASVGRAASFSTLLAARPEASSPVAALAHREPRRLRLETAGDRLESLPLVTAAERRSTRAPAAIGVAERAEERAEMAPGAVPTPRVAAWLDDVGVTERALPALGGSLQRLAAHTERLARGVSLVVRPETTGADLARRVEARVGGERTGVPALTEAASWRQGVGRREASRLAMAAPGLTSLVQLVPELGADEPTLAREVAPIAQRARERAQARAEAEVLTRRLERVRESARLAGLTSYDSDPSASRSDTRVVMALAARAEARRPAVPGMPRPASFGVAELAPRRGDASRERVAAPTAPRTALAEALGPMPVQPSVAARTWQLFSPAKSLSLSMLLAGADDMPAAGAGLRETAGDQAARLGIVLTEGRRALADWRSEAPEAAARQRALTPYGAVAIERRTGGVRAMRLDAVARGPMVQIYSEAPSALDTLAQRSRAEVEAARPAIGARRREAAPGPSGFQRVERAVDAVRATTVTPPRAVAQPFVTSPAIREVLASVAPGRGARLERDLVQRGSVGPRVVATQAPAALALPSAVRPPLALLTMLPEASRRAVGAGEAVALPTQVALPAALTRILRQRMVGVEREPRLQVLGVLESPAQLVGEARPRPMRTETADRLLLLAVEERPAPRTTAEYGRPLATTQVLREAPARGRVEAERAAARPVAARPEAMARPLERVVAELEERAPRAVSAAEARAYDAIAQRQRASVAGVSLTVSPRVVREMVAAGRLRPEALSWIGTVGPLATAWRPELGAVALGQGLGGFEAPGRVELPILAGFELPEPRLVSTLDVAAMGPSAERRVAPRPSMLSRRAEQPLYVTLSDEVAHAVPLATEVARRSLVPMTQVQAAPRAVEFAGAARARAEVAVVGAPRREAAAPARGRWASGVLTRTEGFTEEALERLEGRPRPARSSAAAPRDLVSLEGPKAERGPMIARAVRAEAAGAAPARTRSLVSLPASQAEAIAAQLGGAGRSAERGVRALRLARAASEGALVALIAERPEFTGVSEPRAVESAARALRLPSAPAMVAPRAAVAAPGVPTAPRAVTAAERPVVAGAPTARAAGPTAVREPTASVAPPHVRETQMAGPRRIEPVMVARGQRRTAQMARRSLAVVQREAETELRRHGMTQGRIQRLVGFTPSSAGAVQRVSAPAAERGLSPGWASALLEFASPAAVAAPAPGATRLEGVDARVRQALAGLVGVAAPRAMGLQTAAVAGLPAFVPASAGAPRPSRAAGVQRGDLVAPAVSAAAPTVGRRPAARPPVAAGAPSAAAPAAAATGAQPWTTLRDLAGLVYSSLVPPGAPEAAEGRIRATPNLRWSQRELATLIRAGSDARVQHGLQRPIRPRAAEVTRAMLAYLDAQEQPKPKPQIPGLGMPAGAPGALVTPPAPVPPGRTRLQPKQVEQRALQPEVRVQGERGAQERELVSPSLQMARAPDISIQPLAAMSGGGMVAQRAAETEEAGGKTSPQDKVELMATEVWRVLQDREELEAERLGG